MKISLLAVVVLILSAYGQCYNKNEKETRNREVMTRIARDEGNTNTINAATKNSVSHKDEINNNQSNQFGAYGNSFVDSASEENTDGVQNVPRINNHNKNSQTTISSVTPSIPIAVNQNYPPIQHSFHTSIPEKTSTSIRPEYPFQFSEQFQAYHRKPHAIQFTRQLTEVPSPLKPHIVPVHAPPQYHIPLQIQLQYPGLLPITQPINPNRGPVSSGNSVQGKIVPETSNAAPSTVERETIKDRDIMKHEPENIFRQHKTFQSDNENNNKETVEMSHKNNMNENENESFNSHPRVGQKKHPQVSFASIIDIEKGPLPNLPTLNDINKNVNPGVDFFQLPTTAGLYSQNNLASDAKLGYGSGLGRTFVNEGFLLGDSPLTNTGNLFGSGQLYSFGTNVGEFSGLPSNHGFLFSSSSLPPLFELGNRDSSISNSFSFGKFSLKK